MSVRQAARIMKAQDSKKIEAQDQSKLKIADFQLKINQSSTLQIFTEFLNFSVPQILILNCLKIPKIWSRVQTVDSHSCLFLESFCGAWKLEVSGLGTKTLLSWFHTTSTQSNGSCFRFQPAISTIADFQFLKLLVFKFQLPENHENLVLSIFALQALIFISYHDRMR